MELCPCVITELTLSMRIKEEIFLLEGWVAEPCCQRMPCSSVTGESSYRLHSASHMDMGMVEQAVGQISLLIAKPFIPAPTPSCFLSGFLFSPLLVHFLQVTLSRSIFQAHKSCHFLSILTVYLNLAASCVLYDNVFLIAVFSLYCVLNCCDCEWALYLPVL